MFHPTDHCYGRKHRETKRPLGKIKGDLFNREIHEHSLEFSINWVRPQNLERNRSVKSTRGFLGRGSRHSLPRFDCFNMFIFMDTICETYFFKVKKLVKLYPTLSVPLMKTFFLVFTLKGRRGASLLLFS
jgi:hypothetical protein